MCTKWLSRISVPIAIALATLTFLLAILAAQADGPIIDTQTPNAAISTVFGQTPYAKTGHSLGTGDVNGDGYEDLIVGAPYADLMPSGVFTDCTTLPFNEYVDCVSGGVYLYLGRPEISHTLDLANEPANVTFYVPPEQYSGEELGRSLAVGDLNGDGLDDIVIGTSHYGPSPIGAAFVWLGRRSLTTATAISVNIKSQATAATDGYNLKFVGAWVDDYLGWDVTAGDVNGDHIDDLIVGAPQASVDTVTSTGYFLPDYQRYHGSAADRVKSGAVYVRLGSTGLISFTGSEEDPMRCLPELTIYGQSSYDYFGHSLASGDVDGDGYADIVVGADGADPSGSLADAGKIYVFYGTSVITYAHCQPLPPPPLPLVFENQIVKELAYVTTTADITITGVAAGNRSGYDVSIGNLNDDSYDDIIVGAPYANGNRGQVYVVYGGPRSSMSATIPLAQADLSVSGPTTNTWLGTSVFAGDLNHDGTDDLLMGAIGIDPDDADYTDSPTTTKKGTVYALFGSASLSGTVALSTGNPANLTILGASPDAWLGRGLAAGDLNGDTFNELLVGAPGLDNLTHTGAAYLINLVYPQHITVTGSLSQVVAGDPVTFNATARTWLDSRDVTTHTSFSISPAAGGSWHANVYTSSYAGTWTVTGTFDSLAGSTSLTVLPGPLSTTSISPSTAFVSPDGFALFQASGRDKGGNPIPTLTFTWSIVNGGGQIVASGPTTLTVRAVVTDATYPNTVVATTSGKSATASIVVLNAPPQARFTCGTCTSAEGQPLAFNAASSSDPNHDPLTFAWSFGDGSSASGPTPSHPYPDNGTYTVTLTTTDDKGLTNTAQRTVTVTNVPPSPTITAPATATRNRPVTFTANPHDPGNDTFTYRWDWGDATSAVTTTTAVISHTFALTNTYTVTLRVTDDDGGTGQTQHVINVENMFYTYLPLVVRGQ